MEVIDQNFMTVNTQAQAGILSVTCPLYGKVLYANTEPIQNVIITLSGHSSKSSATAQDGTYNILLQPSNSTDSYTVTPSKNDPNPFNGIDVQDVAFTRRHILEQELFTSPYSVIGADVNQSGSISTLDIVLIQALVLGITPGFPNGKQWTFISSDHVFDNVMSPFIFPSDKTLSAIELGNAPAIDFTGVKLGDVNVSRDNSQQGRIASAGEVTFDIRQEMITEENDLEKIIEVPVRIKDFTDISGYQFTITWDQQKLEYQGVTNKSTSSHFGEHKTGEGILTAMWDDENGKSSTLIDGTELLVLKFKTSGAGTYKDVNLTSKVTSARVYNKDLKLIDHQVTWSELSKQDYEATIKVFPNPFEKTVTVEFYSLKAEEVSFNITDISGKQIGQKQFKSEKGKNTVAWDVTEGNTSTRSGLYIITMKNELGEFKFKAVKN
jgi:hypothetical protein